MRATILGCGGSLGVPMVGNNWGTCDPSNPRNRRRRPSLLVQNGATSILVDTTPDCREQLLDADVGRLDGVVFTHSHADHVHGVDDLRGLTYRQHGPIRGFADRQTADLLSMRFGYAVASVDMDRGLYAPILDLEIIDGPFRVGGIDVIPFVQQHGPGTSLGLRFGPLAYSTDVSRLDEAAFAVLEGVDTWIVDACREAPHPSHAHLALALDWIRRLRPRCAILTHMNHTMDYATLCAQLPDGVVPAYDGLVVEA